MAGFRDSAKVVPGALLWFGVLYMDLFQRDSWVCTPSGLRARPHAGLAGLTMPATKGQTGCSNFVAASGITVSSRDRWNQNRFRPGGNFCGVIMHRARCACMRCHVSWLMCGVPRCCNALRNTTASPAFAMQFSNFRPFPSSRSGLGLVPGAMTARNALGGPRGPRDYTLIAPEVKPSTNQRLVKKNRITKGTEPIRSPAIRNP